ncbi:hypothetical protein BC830DRAFT_1172044 [Chytriomyces sp. MP71]|nr:hypothetical protein BC830DRAFT_1172044 [Chytriomyces sp. MP71]
MIPLYFVSLLAAAHASVLFAPYVDTTESSFDPVAYHTQTGTNWYTLAFVTADANKNPQWAGNLVSSGWYQSQVKAIRAFGGDIIISFGGEAGTELGLVATSASALADTYLSVIQAYNANYVDFDIEGTTIQNTAVVDLRNQALAILQSKLPNLSISYTLPVSTNGLVDTGLYVIQSASKYGVRVDCVNIMTMDYFESIPYTDGNGNSLMGQYAIKAVQATYKQVGSQVRSIGITPMIGVNDDAKEVFTIADAQQVAAFAASNSYVSRVAFWVTNADTNGSYAKTIVTGLQSGSTPSPSKSVAPSVSSKPVSSTTSSAFKSSSSTLASSIKATSTSTAVPAKTPCNQPYVAGTAYNGGAQVSDAGFNWIANWWSNTEPSVSTDGSWTKQGACDVPAASSAVPSVSKSKTTVITSTTANSTFAKTSASAVPTSSAGIGNTVTNGGVCATFGQWACNNACICNYVAGNLLQWQCTPNTVTCAA